MKKNISFQFNPLADFSMYDPVADSRGMFSKCLEAPKSANFTFPQPSDNILAPLIKFWSIFAHYKNFAITKIEKKEEKKFSTL